MTESVKFYGLCVPPGRDGGPVLAATLPASSTGQEKSAGLLVAGALGPGVRARSRLMGPDPKTEAVPVGGRSRALQHEHEAEGVPGAARWVRKGARVQLRGHGCGEARPGRG